MSPVVVSRLNRYISSTPNVLGGMPVIRGTRIPVERIEQLIRQGNTLDEVLEGYSWVSKKKINGAIAQLMKAGLDVFETTQKTQTAS